MPEVEPALPSGRAHALSFIFLQNPLLERQPGIMPGVEPPKNGLAHPLLRVKGLAAFTGELKSPPAREIPLQKIQAQSR
jgi:hypothetical protein